MTAGGKYSKMDSVRSDLLSSTFLPSRTPRQMIRFMAPLVFVLLLVACGSSGTSEASVPVQDSDLVALGDELYQAQCAECHGSDLRGTDQGPSFLSVVYEPGHHSDQAFVLAVLQGVRTHHWDFGNMEPVALEDGDIEAIIAFVRETQQVQGFEPYPP